MGKTMPAYDSPHITKTNARRAIERVAEMRNGTVDVHNSVAGFCNNPGSENYGKVWALLSTEKGTVQYSGYADENLKRSNVKLASNDLDSKRASMVELKSNEGFKDMTSGSLPLYPWDNTSSSYRGMKKCAATKKKSTCKRSSKCSWRKGSYKKYKSGSKKGKVKKVLRKASCAKKSKSMKKKSKSMKKKSKSMKKKCNTLKSGKKRLRKSCKGKKCSWTKGSKGKKGYCHKSLKKSKKKKSMKKKKSTKKKK